MPLAKNKAELNGYFTQNGFVVEEVDKRDSKGEGENDPCLLWAERFKADRYQALFHLGFLKAEKWFSPSVEYLYAISELLITKLTRKVGIELERDAVEVSPSEDEIRKLLDEVPFSIGMEHVDARWITSIWNRLLEVFRNEIKEYEGKVATYFAEKDSNIHVAGRIFFHLVENKDDREPFAFMATYSKKPPKSKKTVHTPLKNALVEFKDNDKKLISLISSVIKAAEKSDLISGLLESGELFSPISLTASEAYTFLKEVPIYEEAGIMCRVPDWWKKKKNKVKMSVSIGDKKPSKVGLDAIMDFSPVLYIGDTPVTESEIREFLKMAQGLVKYKGKWVEINKKKLNDALKAFEKVMDMGADSAMSLSEAMQLQLNAQEALGIESEAIDVTVSNGHWLKELKETLTNPVVKEKPDLPQSLCVELRNYQNDGYHWLQTISKFGFGACLADDMGLGKTVQVIAFLEHIRKTKGGNALLVLPASLIGNWQKELERFAPEMGTQLLHPSASTKKEIEIDESIFLSITTYGMVKRIEELKDKKWDIVILDEAQAIKNPGTKQTKHIKALTASTKIAMTGTPIENRLGDLWSLFDFLNPGLLGNKNEFSNFAKSLKEDLAGYSKLRKMIRPFLLRRLKTDRRIITDLPEKLEYNEYAALSKKQVALYKKLVRKIAQAIDGVEGIERKGLVLSSILKFKQICNHPDQYLGREAYKPASSGKFKQLGEICKTIYEKREKVLIFTQFREITEPIAEYLEEIFGRKGFVFHGGTSVKRRNQIVEAFNSEEYHPFMVLSLKAGGVGLNLTGANHVIHFDRWWNPAVERQATDRVFRIGQTKNVIVHKFVTKGTIEEKIDAMIEEKKQLANDILSSQGEKWLTEYSNDELMELLTLGGD